MHVSRVSAVSPSLAYVNHFSEVSVVSCMFFLDAVL
jgi:hypothetical protein